MLDAQQQLRCALLDAAAEQAVVEARAFARLMRAVAAVAEEFGAAETLRDYSDGVLELAGTLRVSQSRATTLGSDARRLVSVLPRTLAALEAGRVLRPSVELLLRSVRNRSDAVAARVEDLVLSRLEVGTTTDQRRALLEAVVRAEAEVEPEAAEERERAAADLDNVWVTAQDESGRAVVGANLDVLAARRWALDFEELVRATVARDRADGISRSRSQVRAALFATLPSQVIALLKAIAAGQVEELLALTRLDPEAAAAVGALADELAEQPAEVSVDEAAEQAEVSVDEAAEPSVGPSVDQPAEQPAAPGAVTLDQPAHAPLPQHNASLPSRSDAAAPDVPRSVDRRDWFALAADLMGLQVRDPRTVNVFVPMATLLDVDQRGAWVEGVGPMTPFRVRLLASTTPLRRVVCDEGGQPLSWEPIVPAAVGPAEARAAAEHLRARLLGMLEPVVVTDTASRTHDASPRLEALVQLRDQHCTGIGCGTCATSTFFELDHETPWDPDQPYAGPTAVWNLAGRTDRCHQAKHHGWTVLRDERTGTCTWTSALGRSYTRPGAWQAPAELPAELSEPRPVGPITPFVEDDSTWSLPLTERLGLPRPPPADDPLR